MFLLSVQIFILLLLRISKYRPFVNDFAQLPYFRKADNPPTTPITIPTIRKIMAMVLTPPGASVSSPKYMMPMAAVTSNIPNSIALLPTFSPIRSPRTSYAFSYRRDFMHDRYFGIEKINKPVVRVKHFLRFKYSHSSFI